VSPLPQVYAALFLSPPQQFASLFATRRRTLPPCRLRTPIFAPLDATFDAVCFYPVHRPIPPLGQRLSLFPSALRPVYLPPLTRSAALEDIFPFSFFRFFGSPLAFFVPLAVMPPLFFFFFFSSPVCCFRGLCLLKRRSPPQLPAPIEVVFSAFTNRTTLPPASPLGTIWPRPHFPLRPKKVASVLASVTAHPGPPNPWRST